MSGYVSSKMRSTLGLMNSTLFKTVSSVSIVLNTLVIAPSFSKRTTARMADCLEMPNWSESCLYERWSKSPLNFLWKPTVAPVRSSRISVGRYQ